MKTDPSHWRIKIAAWIHDPAEKAIVLLRDPTGHEGGTVRKLCQALFKSDRIPHDLHKAIERADHWAAAADRPQFPREKNGGPYPKWTQVDFAKKPILIHPLSGHQYDLGTLHLSAEQMKAVSFDHFQQLIVESNGEIDYRRTFLNFWRFAPETPASDLGALWKLLPADTRIPDHSIWAHLDLTSAFATAFTLDSEHNPALLPISFGPVQSFIEQARTTSDLWAGSHLLSRIAWEGLKVICEHVGPDAVLFPQLRGIPQVDMWLRNEMKLPAEQFRELDWRETGTDANPLFSAALPNKLVALVPADHAVQLAEQITHKVRHWVKEKAREAFAKLLKITELPDQDTYPAYTQIAEQLNGFPEVHWAVVPWQPLIQETGKIVDTSQLNDTLNQFYPDSKSSHHFLNSDIWKLLRKEIEIEGADFYKPNAGTLYPAVYDLVDKIQAAAKSVRPFSQLEQHGYRCKLCGEREWLTHDREHLTAPSGSRSAETIWNCVAKERAAWTRKGEHLCAPCAVKRLWPVLFLDEVRELGIGKIENIQRYVVSTHTMALATSFARWLESKPNVMNSDLLDLSNRIRVRCVDDTALPKKLAETLYHHPPEVRTIVRRLPNLLDLLRESDDPQSETSLQQINTLTAKVLGTKPETYYGLILLDGDQMGAWLAGNDPDKLLSYQETWHPQICESVKARFSDNEQLSKYLHAKRAVSPARHIAISSALNSFALNLVRPIVEDIGKGKLIYAGGDDVLAMVPVDDLLMVMLLLRLVYSGVFPERLWELLNVENPKMQIRNGFVRFKGTLYRVMGEKATASVGAVIAHHTAPLGSVLRQLRAAEKEAKNQGGRNAFSIRLLKRSGGRVTLTSRWFDEQSNYANIESSPIRLLIRLRDAFAHPKLSRRAAYHVQSWIEQLPEPEPLKPDQVTDYIELLAKNLAYQFKQQGGIFYLDKESTEPTTRTLAELAATNKKPAEFIRDFLSVAEFLAREGRTVYGDK